MARIICLLFVFASLAYADPADPAGNFIKTFTNEFKQIIEERIAIVHHGRSLANDACFTSVDSLVKMYTDAQDRIKKKEGCASAPANINDYSVAGLGQKTIKDMIPGITAEFGGIKDASKLMTVVGNSLYQILTDPLPEIGKSLEDILVSLINEANDDSVNSLTSKVTDGAAKTEADKVTAAGKAVKDESATSITDNKTFKQEGGNIKLMTDVVLGNGMKKYGDSSDRTGAASYNCVGGTVDDIIATKGDAVRQKEKQVADAAVAFTATHGELVKDEAVCTYIKTCYDADYYKAMGVIIAQATSASCLWPALTTAASGLSTSLPVPPAYSSILSTVLKPEVIKAMMDKMEKDQKVMTKLMGMVSPDLYVTTEAKIITNLCGSEVGKQYDAIMKSFNEEDSKFNIKKVSAAGHAVPTALAGALSVITAIFMTFS